MVPSDCFQTPNPKIYIWDLFGWMLALWSTGFMYDSIASAKIAFFSGFNNWFPSDEFLKNKCKGKNISPKT